MAESCAICDNSYQHFLECSESDKHKVCCVCAAKHNLKCPFCRKPLLEKKHELSTKELSIHSVGCFNNGLDSSGGELLIKRNDKLTVENIDLTEIMHILREENRRITRLLRDTQHRTSTVHLLEIIRLKTELTKYQRENRKLEQIAYALIHPIKGEKSKICRFYDAMTDSAYKCKNPICGFAHKINELKVSEYRLKSLD
jgi:hypothetical protein